MSTALYRRYRPESFADVIGQEHVTEPLMQALRTGRVNHAYLFSGPRGCGKTTSARILARCLNCEQGPTPTPCGTCESCVALARGGPGSVDVIEIDAASHGGVDDARDLRERASYGPAQSRYKIYIIDEAHMVTPQGFNALLKIVEEPPEHVKFVFATTEPEKVIGTIRSRTHHYPFRLVPPAKLIAYMERLLEQEGVATEPGVLSFVVRAGGGSVRDSLSVLDQLIAGSGDEGLTYEHAAALLGFTDAELLDATIDGIAARDGAAVFRQVDKVIESGHDPRRFVEDLLERLRDLIIVAAIPDGAGQVLRSVPEDQLERMRMQQSQFGAGELSRAADIVNQGLTEMTGATSPRLQLELICARVLLPSASGEQGYAARLDRLERRLELGGVTSTSRAPEGTAPAAAPATQAPAPPRTQAPPRTPAVSASTASAPTTPAPTRPEAPAAAAPPTPAADASQARDGSMPGRTAPTASSSGGMAAQPAGGSSAGAPPASATDATPPVEKGGPGGLDTEAIRRAWPEVLGRIFQMRRVTWTFLSQHAQVQKYDGRTLTLGIATVGLTNTFRQGNHAELVRQALIDELGIDAIVDGIPATDSGAGSASPPPPAQPAPAPAPSEAPEVPAATPPAGPPVEAAAPGAPLQGGPPGRPQTPGREPGRADRPAPAPESPPTSFSPLQHNAGWGSPAATAPDWGSQSAPPPDWATAGPADVAPAAATAPTAAPAAGGAQTRSSAPGSPGAPAPASSGTSEGVGSTSPRGGRGADAVRRSFAEARAGRAQPSGGGAPARPMTDDTAVSDDDEDIEQSGDVGRSVIERVLGGKVVAELDE